MSAPVHIIIVTHNSINELPLCLKAIQAQTVLPESLVVVDSGSQNTDYLGDIEANHITLIKTTNIGFARANNLGLQSIDAADHDVVVFLNPDAFLTDDIISKISLFFDRHQDVGCLTGKLLGFDLLENKPTGRFDSTGVFRRWYGRWYDRGQGEKDVGQFDKQQKLPAVCGAFMCCRMNVLRSLGNGPFDEDFFMYKEDIDLSLRIRKRGFLLWYLPELVVYHCRGWHQDRRKMSRESRYHSARNELLMYRKHPSIYILWAFAKYISVRFFGF